jgi:hypothetical protein
MQIKDLKELDLRGLDPNTIEQVYRSALAFSPTNLLYMSRDRISNQVYENLCVSTARKNPAINILEMLKPHLTAEMFKRISQRVKG